MKSSLFDGGGDDEYNCVGFAEIFEIFVTEAHFLKWYHLTANNSLRKVEANVHIPPEKTTLGLPILVGLKIHYANQPMPYSCPGMM